MANFVPRTPTPVTNPLFPNVEAQYKPDGNDLSQAAASAMPTRVLPEGLMWQLNPANNEWEVAQDPNWTPQQLFSGQQSATPMFQGVTSPEPFQGQQPSIVSGLFPEVDAMQRALYDQGRQKEMQAQALQFARLSPMEQAQYGLYLGGQQLGGAIGSALGAQDPQLQRISMRHAILKELDPSDPNQQLQVAQRIAQLDPEFAMQIADNARKAAVQIQQANKERMASVPAKIQEAERVALSKGFQRGTVEFEKEVSAYLQKPEKTEATPAKIQEAERVAQSKGFKKGTPEFENIVAEYLQRPEKPEPRPSVGSDAERISLEKFGKNYYDLTQEQRAVVSKAVEVDAAAKAPKVQVDLKDPTATAKASLDVMGKWENFLKSSGDVEVANRYKTVQSAVALAGRGNASADGALLYSIAKMYDPSGAVQEGDKKSVIGNPKIADRFKLLVQGVLEGGTFTPSQRDAVLQMATEIIKNKQSQLNIYRKQYIKKNKDLGGDELDILDPYAGLLPLSAFVK